MNRRLKISALYMSILLFSVHISACEGLPESPATDQAQDTETQKNETQQIETQQQLTMEHLHGSAEKMLGTTLVYSIFASDSVYAWDENSEEDQQTISEIRSYLKIAGDYLSDAATTYGQKAGFITDFQANEDLCSFAEIEGDLEDLDSSDEYAIWDYIESNVNVEKLKEKYLADNVIFFAFMNTDTSTDAVSCTRNWYEGMEYPYEVVFLYNVDYGCQNPPAVYAHEMLHAFGAPDYYMTDEEYIRTYEQQDFVEMNFSNDIMLTCTDMESGQYVYDRITNDFSELTAYYVGLEAESAAQAEAGLGRSQHTE